VKSQEYEPGYQHDKGKGYAKGHGKGKGNKDRD
jgi:hypothetical protein